MRFYLVYFILSLAFLFTNCDENTVKTPPPFSINTGTTSLMLGDTLHLSLKNPKNKTIDKVSYQLNDNIIEPNHVLNTIRLGENVVLAIVSYDEKTDTISKTIKIYNNSIPQVLGYEILNTYPHDITSYTQGLEFYNGELYESTGQRGESKLRKVNFETGEVLKNIDLNNQFFGEGLTVLDKKLYQLTWQSKIGFIYNVDTFEKESTFKYGSSKEGWGICNDGETLYKSDGTEKIWLLNPNDLTEKGHIEVYTEKGKIPALNELEWINGKIYANIYQRNGVAIINPKTGGVDAVVDFTPLKARVTQHDKLDVLNGIAYHPERKTIFVTGKNWDKLFEVKILKK